MNAQKLIGSNPNRTHEGAIGGGQAARNGDDPLWPDIALRLPDIRNSATSFHLDFVRALAAFAVLTYHIRYRFFVDYQELEVKGLLSDGFYLITAFGHDAVMVFFVLSGFLVSSTVIHDLELQRWSWGKYTTDRMTRLYVVLLPGILLTLFWDQLGLKFFGTNPIYTGESAAWNHDYFDVTTRLSLETLVGNMLFLQTILVEPFGSNDPLWSLTYEFWYYLLFPCFYLALGKSGPVSKRAGYLLIAMAILFFVGKSIAIYFAIWLFGTAVCLLPRSNRLCNPRIYRAAVCGSLLIFGLMTVAGHLSIIKEFFGGSVIWGDYLTALGFTLLLYVLVHNPYNAPIAGYAWLARTGSSFSYTLYVVHMPFLIFLRAASIPGEPWQPSLLTYGFAILLLFASLAYAYSIAVLAEFRTPRVKQLLRRSLTRAST